MRVKTDERLARTKMVLIVKNHTTRPQEAQVDLALPANASITRLSMDVGSGAALGHMRGRLMERGHATKVYREIVDREKDPALLEDQGHGDYRLRVFPVPESGTQRVVIEYEHLLPQLDATASYALEAPVLREGAENIRRFSLTVNGSSQTHEQLSSLSTLRVPLVRPPLKAPRVQYAHHQGQTYFRVEIAPDVQAPLREYGALVLAIEAPASSIEEHNAALAEARVISNELRHLPIALVQSAEPRELCKTGQCVQKLPLGSSRLEALLRRASKRAEAMPGPVAVVVITEGRGLGSGEERLLNIARALPHAQSLHLLGMVSPSRRFLSRLARTGGGHFGTNANALLKVIAEPLVTGLRVETGFGAVEGLSNMSEPTRQGQLITFYGRLMEDDATLSVRGRVGDNKGYLQYVALARPKRARNPSLVRAWIRNAPTEIARELSGVQVLTSLNAFLVAPPEERRRSARPPRVVLGCGGGRPSGALGRETIRRHVRLASKKVRHCYNRALTRDPSAEGTVVVQWTITPEGSVRAASVTGEITDRKLHACIAEVHQNMSFPPVVEGGGFINVRYPYLLQK